MCGNVGFWEEDHNPALQAGHLHPPRGGGGLGGRYISGGAQVRSSSCPLKTKKVEEKLKRPLSLGKGGGGLKGLSCPTTKVIYI